LVGDITFCELNLLRAVIDRNIMGANASKFDRFPIEDRKSSE